MKNTSAKTVFTAFGSIVLSALLVFSMACDNGTTSGGSGGGGTFTLTGIPSEYNGKYAVIVASSPTALAGYQTIDMSTGVITFSRISNGKVTIPMWILMANGANIVRYSGDGTFAVAITICSDASIITTDENRKDVEVLYDRYFESVAFSNGSAQKAWSDGMDLYDLPEYN